MYGEASPEPEQRLFRLLAEASRDLMVLARPDRVEWVSPSVGELLGYSPEEILVADPLSLVHPDDRLRVIESRAILRRDGADEGRARLLHRDGDWRWFESRARLVPDDDGRVTDRFLSTWRDIDEHVRAVEALTESERRYRLLVENAHDAVAHARDGRFVWVSPTVEDLSGWRPEQVIGRTVGEFVHPDDFAGLADLQTRRREDPDALLGAQFRLRNALGTYNWVELRVRPFVDVDGTTDGNAVSLRLIDGEVAARQALERRARYDEVTGLMNRTELLERLGELPRRARRSGTELAVLFCDVDGLKVVNDTYGHLAGDLVLRSVADRVVSAVRTDDLVARIGGDELLVVLVGVHDLDQAVEVAEKLRASVSRPLAVDGAALVPSLSIGVALALPGDGPEVLLARADAAMYAAKRAGRDRVAAAGDPVD